MELTPPSRPSRSIAARAADGGIVLGGLIMVLALATGFASYYPVASVLVWVGSIAVPFVLYFLLRRSYAEGGFTESIVELWAEGIATFFLGSLVPALVVYLLLKYVQPDFLASQLDLSMALLSEQGTPEADELRHTIEQVRQSGALPTAAQVAAQLIAFNMFAGMVLSLVEASVLVSRYRNQDRRRRYSERLK